MKQIKKKIRELRSLALRRGLKLARVQKFSLNRVYRFIVFQSRISREVRRAYRMGTTKAVFYTFKLIVGQFMIRPRLRFVTGFILALVMGYFASASAVTYIASKKEEVKINGRAVLVAQKAEETPVEPEMSQSVMSKRSPFEFQRPVDNGYISQGYSAYHRANDIATAYGSPIRSLGPGVVEFAGRLNDGHGNMVVIDHGDGFKSGYAHMANINVGAGNRVTSQTVIGTIGLTGRTTGPHVHLEITDNGQMIDPSSVL